MRADREAVALGDVLPLSALADPVRRRLYELASGAGRPIGRDEAAAAAGVDRSLAAYHLDKLAEHGLLEVEYARPPGRGGPGAGRPSKLYRRSEREFVARVPPRDYRLLAELLVRTAAEERDGVGARVPEAAYDVGRRCGEAAREAASGGRPSIEQALRARGYEPFEAAPGTLRLRNCPFEAIAGEYPDTVCRLNLALVRGLLDGLGTDPAAAVLAPLPDGCCVAIETTHSARIRRRYD
jgi:predicted ArsR family transcriptional regulator